MESCVRLLPEQDENLELMTAYSQALVDLARVKSKRRCAVLSCPYSARWGLIGRWRIGGWQRSEGWPTLLGPPESGPRLAQSQPQIPIWETQGTAGETI